MYIRHHIFGQILFGIKCEKSNQSGTFFCINADSIEATIRIISVSSNSQDYTFFAKVINIPIPISGNISLHIFIAERMEWIILIWMVSILYLIYNWSRMFAMIFISVSSFSVIKIAIIIFIFLNLLILIYFFYAFNILICC